MIGFRSLARSGVVLAILVGLFSGVVTPLAVQADTDLTIGGMAVVAYANGDDVRLRSYPSADAPVIRSVTEGSTVGVVDGPVTADDGSVWYQVSVAGEIGFVAEAFLANASASTEEQTTSPDQKVPNETAIEQPTSLPDGIPGIVAGTNGAGARCRVAPNAESEVLTLVPEGAGIAIVGEAIDAWWPVVCDTQYGYLSVDFVAVNGKPAPAEVTVTEAPTEEATEEPAEEVVSEVATEEPTEVVVSEEASEEPAEEIVTEEATEEPIEVVVTEEATEEPAEEVVTEEATEEPIEEVVTEEATTAPTDETTATPISTATVTTTSTAADPSPVPTALGTPVLSGTGIVLGTNGGGLRCRVEANSSATILTILAEGAVVQVRGDAANGWLPITCDDSAGFVRADFILLDRFGATGSSGTTSDVSSVVDSTTVKGTNGDGLRCRSAASSSASVITVLSEGATVKLRSGSKAEWQAVTCAGQNGFTNNTYLSFDGKTSAAVTVASTVPTGSAIVSGTNGTGLRCRAKASFSAEVLSTLPEGSSVSLRGGVTNAGFQKVFCGGTPGFAVADYLSYVTKTGSSTSQASTTSSTAKVSGTGGTGVRLRSAASTSSTIITVVPEGATVTLRKGSTGDWTAVAYNGSNGFIHKSYLSASTTTTTSGGTATTTPTVVLKNGYHAKTVASVNLRYSASMNGGIGAVAPKGTVVLITGSISNGFYPVDWDGLAGYMHGDYLAKTKLELTSRGVSSDGGTTSGGGTTTGGGGGSPSTGNSSIVDYAMQYLGYPYVWATAGPSSFDCSGYTYWVVQNVLGRDIGRGLFTQVAAGTTVSQSNLQPGDLVFFQNTYTWGLSHVGIYIGNGQFIHSQNESTGVVVSSLSSTYYASRWYGAVRLT